MVSGTPDEETPSLVDVAPVVEVELVVEVEEVLAGSAGLPPDVELPRVGLNSAGHPSAPAMTKSPRNRAFT